MPEGRRDESTSHGSDHISHVSPPQATYYLFDKREGLFVGHSWSEGVVGDKQYLDPDEANSWQGQNSAEFTDADHSSSEDSVGPEQRLNLDEAHSRQRQESAEITNAADILSHISIPTMSQRQESAEITNAAEQAPNSSSAPPKTTEELFEGTKGLPVRRVLQLHQLLKKPWFSQSEMQEIAKILPNFSTQDNDTSISRLQQSFNRLRLGKIVPSMNKDSGKPEYTFEAESDTRNLQDLGKFITSFNENVFNPVLRIQMYEYKILHLLSDQQPHMYENIASRLSREITGTQRTMSLIKNKLEKAGSPNLYIESIDGKYARLVLPSRVGKMTSFPAQD